MRGQRARPIVPLWYKRREVNVADRRLGGRIIRQRPLEAPDVIERANEPPDDSVERCARFRTQPARFDTPCLAIQGIDRKLMVRRQGGVSGRQKLEAEVPEV